MQSSRLPRDFRAVFSALPHRPISREPRTLRCQQRDWHSTPALSQSHAEEQSPASQTSPQSIPDQPPTKKTEATINWSPTELQYFEKMRTRRANELLAQVPLTKPTRIIDLGCGPGTSTAVLKARFPEAHIIGIDSSKLSLAQARERLPGVEFQEASIKTCELPADGVDLIFSSDALHLLNRSERLPRTLGLLRALRPGGVLAAQIPADRRDREINRLVWSVSQGIGTWKKHFKPNQDEESIEFRGYDQLEFAHRWYDSLVPECGTVDMWFTSYQHEVEGFRIYFDLNRQRGLAAFLDALPTELLRNQFLAACAESVKATRSSGTARVSPERDGKVLLRSTHFYLVAVKRESLEEPPGDSQHDSQ